MLFESFSKKEKYLLIAIIAIAVLIMVMIQGIVLMVLHSPDAIVEYDTETIIPIEPTESELRAQAIERAKGMHQEGDSQPTEQQLERMEAMNAATDDMTDEERQVLFESL